MKRALDIGLSVGFLILLWPILLIIAAMIRIESRGPAFLKQKRIGRHGNAFTCYKFRTMFSGTAHVPTHQVSGSSVTRFGTYLRKLKLDELPQLFNVVKGDMSSVGPRPCLTSQRQLIEERSRLGVLDVLPGITGLAQVCGVDMSNPVLLAQLDAQYVAKQNFIGDLKLIWATLCGRAIGIDRVRSEVRR